MSTFADRESLEDKAWHAFNKWLNKGHWHYKRFRYPKDITDMDFSGFEPSLQHKIKSALKKIDFEHDGIMHRGPEHYFFDLKFKSGMGSLGVVNIASYDAYWELQNRVELAFIVVFYIHSTNKLFFHMVENPENFKKEDWSPRVYRVNMNHKGASLDTIVEIDMSLKWKEPKSLIEYYIEARTLEGHKTTKKDIIKEMSEKVYVDPWSLNVPLAKIKSVDHAIEQFWQSLKEWLSE